MCCSLYLHEHRLQPWCKLVHFLSFQIKGKAFLQIDLCLIWLKVIIFDLDAVILKWFNIAATTALHYVIQEYVYEPSTGIAGFYSNVF